MNFRAFLAASCLTLLLSGAAFALDLQQARTGGVLGERADGYVEVLKASPQAQALAVEINAKRRQEYGRISTQNGQPVDVVARLAAQEIAAKLPAGSMYQAADGGWKRK